MPKSRSPSEVKVANLVAHGELAAAPGEAERAKLAMAEIENV